MKDRIPPWRRTIPGANTPQPNLEASNVVEGAVAEIIDAFEQARLIRINHPNPEVQKSMNHIKRSLTLAVRQLAPFAFHAERWLGEEVEKWPGDAD